MNYEILHNHYYRLDFDEADRFIIEAETVSEIEDYIRSLGKTGHFSIFVNNHGVHDFDIIRYEDTQEYKDKINKDNQDRLCVANDRIREILKQHDIELEIKHDFSSYDCEGFYMSFTYKGEIILVDELLNEFPIKFPIN